MRFPYTAADNTPISLMPILRLNLNIAKNSIEVAGLLDTGSAVNVLPYPFGLQLGAVWEEQITPIRLVGNLGRFEARALVAMASHPEITDQPVRLVFAWTKAEDVRVIFGQMNFFLEFDVCFYRSQNAFDVRLKDV